MCPNTRPSSVTVSGVTRSSFGSVNHWSGGEGGVTSLTSVARLANAARDALYSSHDPYPSTATASARGSTGAGSSVRDTSANAGMETSVAPATRHCVRTIRSSSSITYSMSSRSTLGPMTPASSCSITLVDHSAESSSEPVAVTMPFSNRTDSIRPTITEPPCPSPEARCHDKGRGRSRDAAPAGSRILPSPVGIPIRASTAFHVLGILVLLFPLREHGLQEHDGPLFGVGANRDVHRDLCPVREFQPGVSHGLCLSVQSISSPSTTGRRLHRQLMTS